MLSEKHLTCHCWLQRWRKTAMSHGLPVVFRTWECQSADSQQNNSDLSFITSKKQNFPWSLHKKYGQTSDLQGSQVIISWRKCYHDLLRRLLKLEIRSFMKGDDYVSVFFMLQLCGQQSVCNVLRINTSMDLTK